MKRLFIALALTASLVSASAQFGSPPTGIYAAMLKLFGDTKAFTGKAEARILDKEQKEISSLPLMMALRDGKLRAEMNWSDVKGNLIPADAGALMKQSGMDKMVAVARSDKKVTVVSYPGLQSYAEMPFTESEAAEGKVEFTDVGKDETIDGHPCTKKKITTTDSKGRTQEAFVWQARDLKNFPLQMEVPQRSNKVIVKFQPPKLETPDAALFETTAGYTKYDSVQALMQAAMMKMFSGAGAK